MYCNMQISSCSYAPVTPFVRHFSIFGTVTGVHGSQSFMDLVLSLCQPCMCAQRFEVNLY